MEGTIELKVLWMVFLFAIMVILIMMLPNLAEDLFKMIALASADVVSKDLAGLISISGAAPEKIVITYQTPSKEFFYDVKIKDRIVDVKMIGEGKAVISNATARCAVDPEASFKNVQKFVIEKTMENGKNKYKVEAT
jgi:hypothetical protein